MIEEATERVSEAKDLTELEAIGNEFEAKFKEMDKESPDYKPTAEEEKKMEEAMEKFQEACQKKAMEFLGDMAGGDKEE